jgi:rod shape-determining protein MreD
MGVQSGVRPSAQLNRRPDMIRVSIIVFLVNAFLWTVQAQLNHYLAPWNFTIFLGGLCVAYASLRLNFRDGARALLLTGLWFDAATPVPFGLHAFLFLLSQMIIFSFRSRVAREETLVGLLVAVLVNLGLLIAISAALLHRNPAPLEMWPRLIVDSLASFCLVILIGPWAFAFQEQLLHLIGVNLRHDQRGMG